MPTLRSLLSTLKREIISLKSLLLIFLLYFLYTGRGTSGEIIEEPVGGDSEGIAKDPGHRKDIPNECGFQYTVCP